MNQQLPFDDYIKQQLSDYEADVNPAIWDAIADKRRKKRPAAWWWNGRRMLLAASLLLITAAGAIIYQQSKNKDGNADKISGNKSADAGEKHNEQPVIAAKQLNIPTENTHTNNSNHSNPSAAAAVPPAPQTVYSPLPVLPAGTAVMQNRQHPVAISAADHQLRIRKGTGNSRKPATAIPVPADPLTIDAAVPADNNRDVYTIADYSPANRQLDVNLSITKNGLQQLRPNAYPLACGPGCPQPETHAAGNKTYLEAFAGPDMVLRSFTDTANSAYLQQRRATTSIRSAFTAGVRFTKVFGSGMSIGAAATYSQVNERFRLVQANIVQVNYIIDPVTGDTTGTYTVTGTRYKTTYNRYKSIDLALQAGYEWGNGRLHGNLRGGLIFNLYSWQRGEILDMSLNPVNITTGKSNSPYSFKTNIGVGLLGGASLYYRLTNRETGNLHFMLEPYFRYNFSQFNREGITTLKQKNNVAGLRLGVRFDL